MDEFQTQRFFKFELVDHQYNNNFIRPKNFVFAKSNSSKFTNNRNNIILKEKINCDENLFIPKIRSKQLISHPKFFFSVQKKKIKMQKSQPSFPFYQRKVQNPQNKKKKNNLKYFTNKYQINLHQAQNSRIVKKNLSKIKCTQTSCIQTKYQKQLGSFLSEFVSQSQATESPIKSYHSGLFQQNQTSKTSFKKSKRPKFNQNLSFLIRKNKNKKQLISLNKISIHKLKKSQISYVCN